MPFSYFKTVPDYVEHARKIIVVPDVHQDLDKAKLCMAIAGVTNAAGTTWIGGDTVVVQMGDQIDGRRRSRRTAVGPHKCHADLRADIAVLKYFNKMHAKASKHGGAVYGLIGNHELMNVTGDFSYANLYGCAKCEAKRRSEFAPGGPTARLLATTRAVCLKIGRVVFVHAGILPIHARSMDGLNTTMTEVFLDNDVKQTDRKLFDRLCASQDGVLFNRAYSPDNCSCSLADVRYVLKELGADHMVIGHNAHAAGVTALHGGLVYVCDGGMSRAILDGPAKVLEIRRDDSSRPATFRTLAVAP